MVIGPFPTYIREIIPDAPSDLTAEAISDTEIDLSWTDNSDNEDGFKIERSVTGIGGWSQIDTVGVDVETYNDTGLTAGTSYYYRVRAYNGGGNSAYSWLNVAAPTTLLDSLISVWAFDEGSGSSPSRFAFAGQPIRMHEYTLP